MTGNGNARQALFAAVRQLHLRAGEPSSRLISKACGPGTISHTTVSQVIRGPKVARLNYLLAVVKQLDGEVQPFHELWIEARREELDAGSSTAPPLNAGVDAVVVDVASNAVATVPEGAIAGEPKS